MQSFTDMEVNFVVFPCDHEKWSEVKTCLKSFLSYPPQSAADVEEKLQYIYDTIQGVTAKSGVFHGLKCYLSSTDWRKREVFMSRTLLFIVECALNIETLKPDGGIQFMKQLQESIVSIPRRLVSSIVACSFLCLWPGRKFERQSLLNSINFEEFFMPCKSDEGQCAKLECILHYFEELANDTEDVEGNIIFHRQVLKAEEIPRMKEWTKYQQELCPCHVFTTGRIEDAGPNVLQVDFANKKIGGAVLAKGKVQEEIRFSICPELITGQLFIEKMAEQEAITVQGFRNYSDYTGYSRTLKYKGPFPETAQTDALGNLENYMCVIDAVPYRGAGGTEAQYKLHNVLRELNKAYIGFKQDFLQHSIDPLAEEYEEPGPMSNVIESYFSTLSEDIFTMALQETLVSIHDSSSNSSGATHSSGHGQNGRTIPDPLDLMGATLDYARRRSSNLSDISSRRSSSTAGSRRSSGTQLTSSECGSELEEYYQAYQARYNLKPSVIKEETGDSEMQDFASQIMKNIFSAGMEKAKELEPSVQEFSSQHSESVVKPKVHKLTPIYHSLDASSGRSGRRKSPVRWKDHLQKGEDLADNGKETFDVEPLMSDSKAMTEDDKDVELPSVSYTSESTQTERDHHLLQVDVDEVSKYQCLSNNDTPNNIEQFAQELSDAILYQAMRDISEAIHYESQSEGSTDLNVSHDRRRVAGYIGGMLQNIWSHSNYNVRKHFKNQQEQQMWTSDSTIDHDLDLYIYADEFVQNVLNEAVHAYKSEKRQEQQRLEKMWQKALEKFETDAKYFEAEFSRYWKKHSPRERYLNPKSRIQREMLRRRSLDETGRNLMHHEKASGFTDLTLSSFEKELLKSAGSIASKGPNLSNFEQELLSVHPSSAEMLFYSGLRRSSEPAPTYRSSFDAAYCTHLRPSERRRGSSACSTSSREMILDWLNQSQRSSGSSGESRCRTRTTSSHLDWYAQDLLLEAFNDALKDIFGDVHNLMGGDHESVDNSFSSSQSADICDTYIAIPVNSTTTTTTASSSSVSNNHSNNFSNYCSSSDNNRSKSKDCIKMEEGKETSALVLSSTPTEGCLHVQQTHTSDNRFMGARPKVVKCSPKKGEESSTSSDSVGKEDVQLEGGSSENRRVTTESSSRTANIPSAMALHMMEGMCENLSNEVIEGARSSLTTRTGPQRQQQEAQQVAVSKEEQPCVKKLPIATGNWGCGAFQGDPQLKSMIQWAAASCRHAPVVMYYTFGDRRVEQLEDIVKLIYDLKLKVGDLISLVRNYCHERSHGNSNQCTLFEYIRDKLT